MHHLQLSTAGTPDVSLVSFTVDPQHDTPPVLAAYAKHFTANPARWHSSPASRSRLNDLGLHAFKLNSVDGSLITAPKANTARVTERLLADLPVIDLLVEDPPIEEVIDQVFTQEPA